MRDIKKSFKKGFKDHKKSIVLLFCLVLLLIVVDIILSDLPLVDYPVIRYFGLFHNTYLQGIVTNIFGALIVLFFLDTFIKEHEEKKKIENIKKQIYKFNKVLNSLWEEYEKYTLMMLGDYGCRNRGIKLEEDFSFNKLSSMFSRTLSMADAVLSKKAYEYYFEVQREIGSTIKQAILSLNFEGFPQFEEVDNLLLNYYQDHGIHSLYDAIHSNCSTKMGETLISERCIELIKQSTERPELEQGSILIPYILLYDEINNHIKFISTYREVIQRLQI